MKTIKLFINKFLLIILGIILALVILECGLRITGFTISSYQQYKNNKALKNKSQYTIMCLGESTTAGAYPIQLQQILNEKYPNQFSVIDCGMPGTNLEIILGLLDRNINKYNPDIAICMMGINDSRNFTNIEQKNDDYIIQSKKIKLKIIKLFILIKQRLTIKWNLLFADSKNQQHLLNSIIESNYQNTDKATALFKQILEKSEKDSYYYQTVYTRLFIGYAYFMKEEKFKDIAYEMAIDAIHKNYYDKNNYYLFAIKYLLDKNKIPELKTIISLLLKEKDFVPNIDIYNTINTYLTFHEKQILLDKISLLTKDNYHLIAMQYLKEKNYQKAQEYFNKAEEVRLQLPNIETYNLYKLIVKKLIDNNIKVFCMQYPVRSVVSLQEQLKNESYYNQITFISNEKLFKNALMEKDFNEIFSDQFAEDFGHCTKLGNTLIAQNIVNTLENLLDLK